MTWASAARARIVAPIPAVRKRCTTCQRLLRTEDDFYKQTSSPDGRQYNCKKCRTKIKNQSREERRTRGILQPHRNPSPKRFATGEVIRNFVVHKYRKCAEYRGLEFTLSEEQVLKLFASNCFYCGAPPSNQQRRRRNDSGFIYSGIDRYDNLQGYTLGNSVSCCRTCNFAKRDMSADEFIVWARRLVKHSDIKQGSLGV